MSGAPTHPNALPVFTKATRKRVLLRMAITGPSGSGKTFTALTIGQGIAAATGLRLAVLDTEHGSAEKYADLFDFDHLVMANYAARNYEAGIAAAQDGQHSVLVIDSLSHAWAGIGGTLDTVDRYASGHRGDSFGGWREARPEQRALVEALLGAKLHVIVTMRSKQAWEVEKDERGKTRVRKLGLKPEQTDGIEYEFDVAGDMDTDHQFTITKTRAPALNGRIYTPPGADLVGELLDWIKPQKGVQQQPEPEPEVAPEGAAEFPPAEGEPDTRKPTQPQLARLHAMLGEVEVVRDGHLEKHDLANYVIRDTGRMIGSMTELTRSDLDRVFSSLEWMKADPDNALKLMEHATKWAMSQPATPTPEGVPA